MPVSPAARRLLMVAFLIIAMRARPAAAQADLSVSMTGPSSATAGSQLVYTITIANAGPTDADNITLYDQRQNLTTFQSHQQTSGPHLACRLDSHGDVVCTAPLLAAGVSATIVLTFQSDPNEEEVATNTAIVSSETADPNSADNTASFDTAVTRVADVSITAQAGGTETIVPGGSSSHRFTIRNAGPSATTNLTVTITEPVELIVRNVVERPSRQVFDCNFSNFLGEPTPITCSTHTLVISPGLEREIVVYFLADWPLPDATVVTTTATVSHDAADPVRNESATIDTTFQNRVEF